MKMSFPRGAAFVLACALAISPLAMAQGPFTQASLDQILAPIAFYPDTLLDQILMAATHPTDVAQAQRWAEQHGDVGLAAQEDAVATQDWNESVKSLFAFPEVLGRMGSDPGWTEQLGQAFQSQQEEVLSTIRSLRAKALANPESFSVPIRAAPRR